MPFPFKPMPLRKRSSPFTHPHWLLTKLEGFRAIAVIEHGRTNLCSRNGHPLLPTLHWQNQSPTLCPTRGLSLTVREQRSNRDAMAAQGAAWESVGRTTENAAAFGGRCRWESVRSTTVETLDESPQHSSQQSEQIAVPQSEHFATAGLPQHTYVAVTGYDSIRSNRMTS